MTELRDMHDMMYELREPPLLWQFRSRFHTDEQLQNSSDLKVGIVDVKPHGLLGFQRVVNGTPFAIKRCVLHFRNNVSDQPSAVE